MAIKKKLIYITVAVLMLLPHCSREKNEQFMVDMDSIQSDGSNNQRYIFREEIEREERRTNRYNSSKDKF